MAPRPGEAEAGVAVVIPSFRAAATIGPVLARVGPDISRIYVVDDGCPEATGAAAAASRDPRVTVLRNPANLGVGGAVKRGYREALADGARIVVKLDADAQMDPRHIPLLIAPILAGEADYAKGNRFAPPAAMPPGSDPDALSGMPRRRRAANRLLSLVHKLATGNWRIEDPANGFTAIARPTLEKMRLDDVADCFFFETDMLFRLERAGAIVADVPLPAHYPGTGSNLSLRRIAFRFAGLIAIRTLGLARASEAPPTHPARLAGAAVALCAAVGLTAARAPAEGAALALSAIGVALTALLLLILLISARRSRRVSGA